ncbi:MAG: hypothetical protein DHS20C16_27570 [Phycisphaerae bacterium]|nr:MAG: hypothetical protein DHS20C16_27570 [Phycisphaerae bacterium]
MKLSKVLATAAAFGLALPVMADTLELRVVTTGDADTASHGVVPVIIQGQILGATDDGLALWGANLSDAGAGGIDVDAAMTTALDSPNATIDNFKKNLGLTNPAGYGGTAIGGNLIQIGGGQNTIGNAGPTLFPVGPVVTNVANGGWVDLATGSIDTTGELNDVILTLDTGFANTLASDTGPVFPVNAATVTIGGSLTIGGGADDLDFTAVVSTANHNASGSFTGGVLDIPVDATTSNKADYIEPRQSAAIGGGDLAIRVDFAEAITGGSVSSNPALGSLTATPNGSSLDITFDAPANGTCYSFDITGTTSAANAVGTGSADTDFCVCYQEGDINYDSIVNLGDRAVVAAPANFFNTMDAGGIDGPQVDLNRDGIMNLGDRAVVAAPANFFNDFTAVACP